MEWASLPENLFGSGRIKIALQIYNIPEDPFLFLLLIIVV